MFRSCVQRKEGYKCILQGDEDQEASQPKLWETQ